MTYRTALQTVDLTTRAAHAEMCRIQDLHGAYSPEAAEAEAAYDAAAEARAVLEEVA